MQAREQHQQTVAMHPASATDRKSKPASQSNSSADLAINTSSSCVYQLSCD